MLISALFATALAGSAPLVEVHATALSEFADEQGAPGVGGGVVVGVNAFGPLWMEAVVEGGWTPAAPARVALWPRLRVFATPRDDTHRAALSFAAGAGIQALPASARGQFDVSTALDVRVGHNLALRFEGGWAPTTTTLSATRFTVGLAWSRPVAEPVAEQPVPTPWLPYPECRFVGPAEADAYFGDGLVVATRSEPVSLVTGPARPAPSADGAVWVTPGSGDIAPDTLRFAGHQVWARRLPEPVTVVFALSESTLGADEIARIRAAAAAPEVAWRVYGSYSAEGDPDTNRALALARAQAVREVLLDAGVPASRVLTADVVAPQADASLEAQRTASLVPELAPEGSP